MAIKGMPVQRRGRERREAIVAAAEELIDLYGPFSEELTVRAIAERAGISVGALYHYFADIDSVIAAVAQRFMEHVMAETEAARPREGDTWFDLIERSNVAFQSLFRQRPGLRELWFNRRSPPAVAEIHQHYHRLLALRSQQWFHEVTGVRLDLTVHLVLATMLGALLELAFRDDPRGDPYLLGEVRRVQRAYYRSHLEALPRPSGEPPASAPLRAP